MAYLGFLLQVEGIHFFEFSLLNGISSIPRHEAREVGDLPIGRRISPYWLVGQLASLWAGWGHSAH
jgi:hypothetical protein